MTSQFKRTSLALAKTDRIMQCNEQHRMNDLVEIVGEVAGLQLATAHDENANFLLLRILCCALLTREF